VRGLLDGTSGTRGERATAGTAVTASSATALARANVALVKYWGKRDEERNLPAVGSISLTLDGLEALATVQRASGAEPRFRMNGRAVAGVAGARMARFLDGLARHGDAPLAADVEANFPVGAGLASSAAIFCAVTAAALSVLGRRVDRGELSALARQGSGSAARSVYGGLVEWARGVAPDGRDSIAHQLLPESAWDLAMLVAITSEEMKGTASRDAMRAVAETSPLYRGWLEAQEEDLAAMRVAIERRDLAAAGRIAEENCLRMHATCFGARPPVFFWSSATVAAMEEVRALRGDGTPAYFTIDAGPQVKVLCLRADAERVAERLAAVRGVRRVLRSGPGGGVEMVRGEAPWS
jgi:diphosphomevalonate decarboxylase